MSLYAGLSYTKRLGGIIGFACYLFPHTKIGDINKSTPIFLFHAEDDDEVYFEKGMKSYKRFEESNDFNIHKCFVKEMGHNVTKEIFDEVRKWLQKIL
mmetsp:Transcript_12696/g.10852  ORF Transcript_12696/g.10852 Transcript_12696/m.10852 type:complete len:98 (-) Transcript_12696:165-458(-)